MSIEAITAVLPDLAKHVIELFIVVDPIGNIPIFMGLTKQLNSEQRRSSFRTATLTGFLLLSAFALAGQQVLSLFGITLQQFMVAGGVLLLALAIRLLVFGGWTQGEGEKSFGAFPMACPLLTGPGAITTTILNLQTLGAGLTFASVVVTYILVGATLHLAEKLYRFLGNTGAEVISGVMAIFIAAIAVGFIARGITGFVTG
jgi:multiple antibiotic resistance protein